MPIDPFFTSAHKKHYIENPEFTALIAKVRAMPPEDRRKWMLEMKWKPLGQRSYVEAAVYKALSFEFRMAMRCKQRRQAEQFGCDINEAAKVSGCIVLHGHGSTGGHRSMHQVVAKKAWHDRQGARRQFDRVYNKGRKPK